MFQILEVRSIYFLLIITFVYWTAYREGDELNHFMRIHLVGAPSAPGNLNGKQWSEYIPTSTSSSFSASTGIILIIICIYVCLVSLLTRLLNKPMISTTFLSSENSDAQSYPKVWYPNIKRENYDEEKTCDKSSRNKSNVLLGNWYFNREIYSILTRSPSINLCVSGASS